MKLEHLKFVRIGVSLIFFVLTAVVFLDFSNLVPPAFAGGVLYLAVCPLRSEICYPPERWRSRLPRCSAPDIPVRAHLLFHHLSAGHLPGYHWLCRTAVPEEKDLSRLRAQEPAAIWTPWCNARCDRARERPAAESARSIQQLRQVLHEPVQARSDQCEQRRRMGH